MGHADVIQKILFVGIVWGKSPLLTFDDTNIFFFVWLYQDLLNMLQKLFSNLLCYFFPFNP